MSNNRKHFITARRLNEATHWFGCTTSRNPYHSSYPFLLKSNSEHFQRIHSKNK